MLKREFVRKTEKYRIIVFIAFILINFPITAKESDRIKSFNDSLKCISDTVFNQNKLRTYSLDIIPEDWKYMQNNIVKEQYVPARLSVDGKDVGTVGIRYKGSTFTLEGCAGLRDGEWCSKISMKIKFNKYDKNLRFYGLKRLNFNSMMYDPSALRERLAYSIFTDMNVITSRACHARIVINGECRGLFSLVEQIDDVFVKRNFPEKNDGSLIKEKWPVSDDHEYYEKGIKIGNPKTAVSDFVNLYNDLSKCDESKLTTFIKKRMDSDYLMRYMAVDRTISNWDGVTAFYPVKNENFKGFASHNYYWYKEKDKNFFWLLPWDLDGTMAVNTGFDHVPEWNEIVKDNKKTYSIFEGETIAVAPSSDKLMRGIGFLGNEKSKYKKALKKLLNGPFRKEYLEAKIELWSKQIAPFVKDDKYGPVLSVWKNAVQNLSDEVSILRTRLENRINDTKPSPFVWSHDQVNGFDTIDDYNFFLGMYRFCNLKSCVRLSLNRENPISGKCDIRADFDMYNDFDNPEEGAQSQWVWIGSKFHENKEIDFVEKNIVGVRFKAFSDRDRKIWVSIKSEAYHVEKEGCHLGNNFDITTVPQTIELYFKDGKFPFWMPPLEEYSLEKILRHVTDFNLSPEVDGLQENGVFKKGDHDKGFVQIDDITFIYGDKN